MAASGEGENQSYRDNFDANTFGFQSRFATIEENEPTSSSEDVTKSSDENVIPFQENSESSSGLDKKSSCEAIGDTSETSVYVPPSEDPYKRAWKYLAKHDILHLFQGITSNIFYHKPGDPLEDMIKQIEKLQEEDRIRKGVIKRSSETSNSP